MACGYPVSSGESGGGILGAIVGLFFLCFCIGAAWFVCKSCNGGDHHSSSERSEHIVEEVIVETKVVEEIHHDNGQGYG